MRRKTELRVKKLLWEIQKTAERYIADGNEHTAQIMGLVLEEGRYRVDAVIVVPMFDDEQKTMAAHAMGAIVEPFDAYIFITEAWMLVAKSRAEVDEVIGHVKEHPNRVECFQLHFVTKMGEELCRCWKIVRPAEGRAYLEHMSDTETPMEGRFANFYSYTFPPTGGKGQ